MDLSYSLFEISISISFNFCCFDSTESNRFPGNVFFNRLNSEKSHGGVSGEYGACGAIYVEFLVKHCIPIYFISFDEWLHANNV